jgi:hypothetical protein
MSSVTALQLVNRVRLYRRQPTTTSISTPEDEVTLNALNMAIDEILTEKKWEFNVRHDGQLTLKPVLDSLTFFSVGDSASASIFRTPLVDSDVFGNFVTRVLADEVTEYANTTFRIQSSQPVILGGSANVQLATSFGVASSLDDCELHYTEYMLPDTVESVIRVSYQENQLDLEQVDPVLRYQEIFPRPQIKKGPPEAIAVGGYDIQTYDNTVATPDPKLRLAVWPVPDDEYVIDYSYYVRRADLAVATDTLVGVPTAVVNDIVMKATSIVKMTWDADYAAQHFGDLAEAGSFKKHRNGGGSSGRRRRVYSFETGSGLTIERGFPDRLIG